MEVPTVDAGVTCQVNGAAGIAMTPPPVVPEGKIRGLTSPARRPEVWGTSQSAASPFSGITLPRLANAVGPKLFVLIRRIPVVAAQVQGVRRLTSGISFYANHREEVDGATRMNCDFHAVAKRKGRRNSFWPVGLRHFMRSCVATEWRPTMRKDSDSGRTLFAGAKGFVPYQPLQPLSPADVPPRGIRPC